MDLHPNLRPPRPSPRVRIVLEETKPKKISPKKISPKKMSSDINLEEDYEANYPDGWRPDPMGGPPIPVGLCPRMCSYEEMQERETNQRLNKYEQEPNIQPQRVDFSLAIKEFKRSCVGREFTSSMELRPWSVLKRALDHLLLNICFKDDDWMFICDFVFDRLKAIRQDMVIQRIEGKRYVEVLEGSVRFLIYSMYKLTCALKDYSKIDPLKPYITLEGPVKGLNNYEMHVVREMKLTMKCLRDCLSSLIVQYQENVPDSPYRSTFEAVNLVVNLPFLHGHAMNSTNFQATRELRNSDPTFKIVFKMYREHLAGNHWTAMKNLPRLTDHPLLVLAYAPAMAQLQVRLVQLMKKCYSTAGSNTSSVDHLCSLICPDWLEEDHDERIGFGKSIATQFGFYDEKRNLCDYKLIRANERVLPRDFVEKAQFEARKAVSSESDNETRTYALQMIAGKDWSIYRQVLRQYGVESVLDPSQPSVDSE